MDLSRREILKTTVSAGAAALTGCASAGPFQPPVKGAARDIIREENAKPGTRDWMLTNTRIDPATKCRCPWVEGYCSRTSVRAGETLQVFVSTNPASGFTIDLYRLGYYGGAGGRHVTSLGPFEGKVQRDPPVGTNRLRECRWE